MVRGSREFFEKVLQERPFQMREVMPGSTWCFEDIWLMFFRREAYELTSYPVQKRKWDLVSFSLPQTGHIGVGDDPRECIGSFRGSHPWEKEETNMRVDSLVGPGKGRDQSTIDAVSRDQENLVVAYSMYVSKAHRC